MLLGADLYVCRRGRARGRSRETQRSDGQDLLPASMIARFSLGTETTVAENGEGAVVP